LLLFVTLFAAAAGPTSQQQGQGQQPAKQQPTAQPGQALAPAQPATPAVNKEEEDAYKAFFELKRSDLNEVIRSGEEFLKKFSESRYRGSVYSRLVEAYWSTQQLDKLNAVGQKALEMDPNNVDVLAVMGYVLPRRFNPNDLDAEQKLTKYEEYSRRAIKILGEMPKPARLTEEDFARIKNQALAMCHSGLGFVFYHRQRLADAAREFEQATKMVPESTDFYVLGVVYDLLKRPQDSENAFGHCAEMAGPMQEPCKLKAEALKKALEAAPKP
jgi:tetratricopeptide (TPR) repeat protein